MARLTYRDSADLPEAERDLLQRPITLHRALVNSPGAARAFQGLGGYIRHGSRLDPRLREMGILQIGWLARSPYEWSHHVKIGMSFGVTEGDIRCIMSEQHEPLEPLARTVLRAATEMVGGGTSEQTHEALAAHLEPELIVDLVVTLAFYCAVVRVLTSLEIDVEPEYQPYLDRFPLPR